MDQLDQQELDELSTVALEVAQRMPFAVEVAADMSGTWVPQIMLGRRGVDEDDPQDRASIDPGDGEVWAFDVNGGEATVMSSFDRSADPAAVARWIADEAVRHGSPAAVVAAAPPMVDRISDLKQQHAGMATWAAEHGGGPVRPAPAHSGPAL